MKQALVFVSFIVVVLLLGFLFFSYTDELSAPSGFAGFEKTVCVNVSCFNVEIADTDEKRKIGLMYREELDEAEGMFFIFPEEGIYPFWMKNTLIPLDIIWIDNSKRVVFIYKNSQPCGAGECPSINPGVNAQYVLEINAGFSDNLGINVGDTVIFETK